MKGYRDTEITTMEWNQRHMRSPYIEVAKLNELGLARMLNDTKGERPVLTIRDSVSMPDAYTLQSTVFKAFAIHFHVDVQFFDYKGRQEVFVFGRNAYAYFARRLFPSMTLKSIGRSYRNISPDHSTIINSINMVNNVICTRHEKYYPLLEELARSFNMELKPI